MFRILSLDGGGVRGAFIAACLAEIEKKMKRPVIECFDLVAGTSSGGMIACLMAAGVPMAKIKEIYTSNIEHIFMPMKPYFDGVYRPISIATSPFLELFTGVTTDELMQAKYSHAGLENLVSELIGNKTIGEIDSCRVLITAVDLINGKPTLFKTQHLPFHYSDKGRRCIDVIKATTAAPTYFNPAEIEPGSAFCDGGLWANNPAVVAFSEAVHISTTCTRAVDPQFRLKDIHCLSIGSGYAHYSHVPPDEGAGFKWWARRTMEIMFDSQSQSTCFLLHRMMSKNFYRIDFELPDASWAAMDCIKHANEIVDLGAKEGSKHFERVAEQFLSEPADPFCSYGKAGD